MSNILPTTNISFRDIATLRGSSGNVLPTTNISFSKYYNQDVDIPIQTQPIKFSDFKEAVSYDNTFSITVSSVPNITLTAKPTQKTVYKQVNLGSALFAYYLSSGDLATPKYTVIYKKNNKQLKNSYPAIRLQDIDSRFTFWTKHSTPTTSNPVYVSTTASITAYVKSTIDSGVTLWAQIDDESEYAPKKVAGTTKVVIKNPTIKDILSVLNLNENMPQVVSTLSGESVSDPFIFKQGKYNTIQTVNATISLKDAQTAVTALVKYANAQSILTQYAIPNLTNVVVLSSITISITNYSVDSKNKKKSLGTTKKIIKSPTFGNIISTLNLDPLTPSVAQIVSQIDLAAPIIFKTSDVSTQQQAITQTITNTAAKNIVQRLTAIAASQTANNLLGFKIPWTANAKTVALEKITVDVTTYTQESLPICRPIITLNHGDPGSSVKFATVVIPSLSAWGIGFNDNIKFYISAGPSTAESGASWSSGTVTLTIDNHLRPNF